MGVETISRLAVVSVGSTDSGFFTASSLTPKAAYPTSGGSAESNGAKAVTLHRRCPPLLQ